MDKGPQVPLWAAVLFGAWMLFVGAGAVLVLLLVGTGG